jgi:hypothetical protein
MIIRNRPGHQLRKKVKLQSCGCAMKHPALIMPVMAMQCSVWDSPLFDPSLFQRRCMRKETISVVFKSY